MRDLATVLYPGLTGVILVALIATLAWGGQASRSSRTANDRTRVVGHVWAAAGLLVTLLAGGP